MATLHTYQFKVIRSQIRGAIPVTGQVSEETVFVLSQYHERALEAFENGDMREDEFQEIRELLRSYGLTELFC